MVLRYGGTNAAAFVNSLAAVLFCARKFLLRLAGTGCACRSGFKLLRDVFQLLPD